MFIVEVCFLGSIITVTPHQSEVATDHEDVDAYPTFLDLSKNTSGLIVCTMLNIPPLVMSVRSQVMNGCLPLCAQILHRMMLMTVRQVQILQHSFKVV